MATTTLLQRLIAIDQQHRVRLRVIDKIVPQLDDSLESHTSVDICNRHLRQSKCRFMDICAKVQRKCGYFLTLAIIRARRKRRDEIKVSRFKHKVTTTDNDALYACTFTPSDAGSTIDDLMAIGISDDGRQPHYYQCREEASNIESWQNRLLTACNITINPQVTNAVGCLQPLSRLLEAQSIASTCYKFACSDIQPIDKLVDDRKVYSRINSGTILTSYVKQIIDLVSTELIPGYQRMLDTYILWYYHNHNIKFKITDLTHITPKLSLSDNSELKQSMKTFSIPMHISTNEHVHLGPYGEATDIRDSDSTTTEDYINSVDDAHARDSPISTDTDTVHDVWCTHDAYDDRSGHLFIDPPSKRRCISATVSIPDDVPITIDDVSHHSDCDPDDWLQPCSQSYHDANYSITNDVTDDEFIIAMYDTTNDPNTSVNYESILAIANSFLC